MTIDSTVGGMAVQEGINMMPTQASRDIATGVLFGGLTAASYYKRFKEKSSPLTSRGAGVNSNSLNSSGNSQPSSSNVPEADIGNGQPSSSNVPEADIGNGKGKAVFRQPKSSGEGSSAEGRYGETAGEAGEETAIGNKGQPSWYEPFDEGGGEAGGEFVEEGALMGGVDEAAAATSLIPGVGEIVGGIAALGTLGMGIYDAVEGNKESGEKQSEQAKEFQQQQQLQREQLAQQKHIADQQQQTSYNMAHGQFGSQYVSYV